MVKSYDKPCSNFGTITKFENEKWKKIDNCDDYSFSNYGRVYGFKYKKIMKLKDSYKKYIMMFF